MKFGPFDGREDSENKGVSFAEPSNMFAMLNKYSFQTDMCS